MKALLRLSLVLPLMALAGCSVLGTTQRDPVTIYSPDVRIPADPAWPTADWSLVIAKPTAARVVDSPRISVRPVPGELQVTGAPPGPNQRRISCRMRCSGRWKIRAVFAPWPVQMPASWATTGW